MQEEKVPISPNVETDTAISLTLEQTPKTDGIGKFKVLYRSESTLIALGPDYWFFIPAFSLFLFAGVVLFRMGLTCSQSIAFKVITCLIAMTQPLSYLFCALTNPGVVTQSVLPIELVASAVKGSIRFCKDCNIYVNTSTRHCEDCQLCIDGYDHHCPWVSKCIGKHNLKLFYLFVIMTPIFLVYVMVCTGVCFADFQEFPHSVSKHANHHG